MSDQAISVCFYCADQNPHRDQSRGITNYTYGLLTNLKKSGQIKLQALASKSSAGVPEGISTTVIPFRTDHIPGRLLADHFHPLIAGRRVDAAIWHYPKGFLPFGPQVRRPKIGTIADTILQFYADHYPSYRSQLGHNYWIAMLKNAIRHFDLILTVSEFSKQSILDFSSRYRLKIPEIVVTYQGVDDFDIDPSINRTKQGYVLHLTAKQPHKKTNWLLKEWGRLQKSGVSLPALRLIGQMDADGHERAALLKNTVVEPATGRAEIATAMRDALALILPSEIEGFGLPALEAYYCGTPVVYAKSTAVAEVLGDDSPGGFTFETDSFLSALEQTLIMSPGAIEAKRRELRDRFSWQKCVERTVAGYRTLLQRQP
jgi:glycosyltransferase involved in cell wall biosynthesis